MKIEHFVAQSLGKWRSMRSSHSLAFKQFEEVVSNIEIQSVDVLRADVRELLESFNFSEEQAVSPFTIKWEADSNWGAQNEDRYNKGSTILIPIERKEKEGLFIRSMGYTEKIKTLSKYKFLSDGTLILSTKYNESLAEERIWFASKNVRCRSSIVSTSNGSAIIQASFCSEIRVIS